MSPYAQLCKAWRFQQNVHEISVVVGFISFVQLKTDFGNSWYLKMGLQVLD